MKKISNQTRVIMSLLALTLISKPALSLANPVVQTSPPPLLSQNEPNEMGPWFWVIDVVKDIALDMFMANVLNSGDNGSTIKLEQMDQQILTELQQEISISKTILHNQITQQLTNQMNHISDTNDDFKEGLKTFGYQSSDKPFYAKFRSEHPAGSFKTMQALWESLSKYDRDNQSDPSYQQGSLTETFFKSSRYQQLGSLDDLTNDTLATLKIIGTSATTNAQHLPKVNKMLDQYYQASRMMLLERAKMQIWSIWFGMSAANQIVPNDDMSAVEQDYFKDMKIIHDEYNNDYNLAKDNAAQGPYQVQYCNNTPDGQETVFTLKGPNNYSTQQTITNHDTNPPTGNNCYFYYPTSETDAGNFEMDVDEKYTFIPPGTSGLCSVLDDWKDAAQVSVSKSNQRFIGFTVNSCNYEDMTECHVYPKGTNHELVNCTASSYTVSAHDAGFDPTYLNDPNTSVWGLVTCPDPSTIQYNSSTQHYVSGDWVSISSVGNLGGSFLFKEAGVMGAPFAENNLRCGYLNGGKEVYMQEQDNKTPLIEPNNYSSSWERVEIPGSFIVQCVPGHLSKTSGDCPLEVQDSNLSGRSYELNVVNANQKQVKLEQFNNTGKCSGCDLSGISFSNHKSSSCDLSKALLNRSTFSGTYSNCTFQNAQMRNVSMMGTFANVNFTDANLNKAQLNLDDFTNANFSNANLKDANLAGAVLYGSNITKSQLDQVHTYCNATMPDGRKHKC